MHPATTKIWHWFMVAAAIYIRPLQHCKMDKAGVEPGQKKWREADAEVQPREHKNVASLSEKRIKSNSGALPTKLKIIEPYHCLLHIHLK